MPIYFMRTRTTTASCVGSPAAWAMRSRLADAPPNPWWEHRPLSLCCAALLPRILLTFCMMTLSQLGDSELSDDDDDPVYMESDNERDEESEDDCGSGSAAASPSSKRKRDDGERAQEV